MLATSWPKKTYQKKDPSNANKEDPRPLLTARLVVERFGSRSWEIENPYFSEEETKRLVDLTATKIDEVFFLDMYQKLERYCGHYHLLLDDASRKRKRLAVAAWAENEVFGQATHHSFRH